MNQDSPSSGRPVFEGRLVRLEDGRYVSLDWLIWNARQQQSRAVGRLCGALLRAVWQTIESLVGPPLGWQRRQLPSRWTTLRDALGPDGAADRIWFDPSMITDSENYRSDAALGRKATATNEGFPERLHGIQGSRSAAA